MTLLPGDFEWQNQPKYALLPGDPLTTYHQIQRESYQSGDQNWRKILRILLAAEEFSK